MRRRNEAQRSSDLPQQIKDEIGPLIPILRVAGWMVSDCYYDPKTFDNWYADLTRGDVTIRLVKDRSQYYVGGPIELFKAADLQRAFSNLNDFREAVVGWANEQP